MKKNKANRQVGKKAARVVAGMNASGTAKNKTAVSDSPVQTEEKKPAKETLSLEKKSSAAVKAAAPPPAAPDPSTQTKNKVFLVLSCGLLGFIFCFLNGYGGLDLLQGLTQGAIGFAAGAGIGFAPYLL